MATQNLVSASITPEAKDEILKSLANAGKKLEFLLTLPIDEAARLFKAGKELLPFLEECHKLAQAHPEILSGVFDLEEYERDYRLVQDLGTIADRFRELTDAIEHTLTAVRSDHLAGSLDVYASAKANRDKVPGLGAVVDRLAAYFKKPNRAARSAN